MKYVSLIILCLSLAACGPSVGVSRQMSLYEFPESSCVLDTVREMDDVSSVAFARLAESDWTVGRDYSADVNQVHEYRYVFRDVENSFSFYSTVDGDISYKHEYRRDNSYSNIDNSDMMFDFMQDVEEELEDRCDVDTNGGGSTRVCARLIGSCPKS